jgi:hypothetical protein
MGTGEKLWRLSEEVELCRTAMPDDTSGLLNHLPRNLAVTQTDERRMPQPFREHAHTVWEQAWARRHETTSDGKS